MNRKKILAAINQKLYESYIRRYAYCGGLTGYAIACWEEERLERLKARLDTMEMNVD